MKNLQVIILAGGEGKRFWPLITNKVLIKFLGHSLISHLFDQVLSLKPEKIIVVASPQNQSAITKKAKRKKINVLTALQKEPRGMANALLAAKDLLEPHPLLVLNGDDYCQAELLKEIILKGERKNQLVLTGWETKKYFPGGYFSLKNDQVAGIVEKPEDSKQPSQFIRLVVDFFPNALEFLKMIEVGKNDRDDLYEVGLNEMIKKHGGAGFIHYQGFWGHLKYPWHVLEMMDIFLEEHLKKSKGADVYISPKATIEGKVFLSPGVKVFEGAKIKGPAWIGKETIIGNNALVRQSQIGKNCVIGYNTEIVRSYIGKDCWFHGNYVGDSVLEANVSFGSGARIANLRLDEGEVIVKRGKEKINTGREKLGAIVAHGTRVGINASLMPGVLIAQDSFVGPGVVLNQNLKANSFCRLKQSLTVVKNQKKATVSQRDKFKRKI